LRRSDDWGHAGLAAISMLLERTLRANLDRLTAELEFVG